MQDVRRLQDVTYQKVGAVLKKAGFESSRKRGIGFYLSTVFMAHRPDPYISVSYSDASLYHDHASVREAYTDMNRKYAEALTAAGIEVTIVRDGFEVRIPTSAYL